MAMESGYDVAVCGGGVMLSMQVIENAVNNYHSKELSIDTFEQWFRDNSRGMFGESSDVLEACLSIESAFSHLRFDDISEEEFREELATAVRPFAAQKPRKMYVWRIVELPEVDQVPVAKRTTQRWTGDSLPRLVMAASCVALLGCTLYGFNTSERRSRNFNTVKYQYEEV
jgi:hypothetical protein